MAVVFIVLIILSLVNMKNDIQKINRGQQGIAMGHSIVTFDTVLVGKEKYLGVVEQVTNTLYHVVYRDKFGRVIHAIYTKEQLQKVLIVLPHTHE